jgi:hypothetical protein
MKICSAILELLHADREKVKLVGMHLQLLVVNVSKTEQGQLKQGSPLSP